MCGKTLCGSSSKRSARNLMHAVYHTSTVLHFIELQLRGTGRAGVAKDLASTQARTYPPGRSNTWNRNRDEFKVYLTFCTLYTPLGSKVVVQRWCLSEYRSVVFPPPLGPTSRMVFEITVPMLAAGAGAPGRQSVTPLRHAVACVAGCPCWHAAAVVVVPLAAAAAPIACKFSTRRQRSEFSVGSLEAAVF